MVINPLIDGNKFTKCMVDSGSSINIMYLDTLHNMNLMEANLRRTSTVFHGVVPGFRLLLAMLTITTKSA